MIRRDRAERGRKGRRVGRFLSAAMVLLVVCVSAGSAKPYRVKKGDTLAKIAARELGDAERWREIADENEIDNPRRLLAGRVIEIPEERKPAAAPVVSGKVTAHLLGVPSIRGLAGSIRFRVSEKNPWVPLWAARDFAGGSWVMTASTGRADFVLPRISGEIGPYSIVEMETVQEDGAAFSARVHLGELDLSIEGGEGTVHAGDATARTLSGEIYVRVNEKKEVLIAALKGKVEVKQEGIENVVLEAGQTAQIASGNLLLDPGPKPLATGTPEEGAVLAERDLSFEWPAVSGVTAYRFSLIPKDLTRPRVERVITDHRIIVRKVPEGSFAYQVVPLGAADRLPGPRVAFVVDRRRPEVKAWAVEGAGGGWIVKGTATPGATVTVGREKTTAGGDGSFSVPIQAQESLFVVGIEARLRPNGPVARTAVALVGLAEKGIVSAAAAVPAGRVLADGKELPAILSLQAGKNEKMWKWEVGGKVVAAGRSTFLLDREPPRLVSVKTARKRIAPGEEILLTVAAADAGSELGSAETARVKLNGPGDLQLEATAERLTPAGEYIFRIPTPEKMSDGFVQVTEISFQDSEGNRLIISTDGMVTETVDPQGKARRFFGNILLVGIGVLVGSL
ncbi:MAG: LysM domain-containing protein [Candidatus Hydrogenedentota bacterium]|nr:MAG: LysM domain-containing protein [Candidatus Hydrogenedentota bacterium]